MTSTPPRSETTFRPVTEADLPALSALHARALGPGRFAKSAYRVREGTAPVSPYCRLAECDGTVIAAVRFTPVLIGGLGGALLLGPLAVDPAHTKNGLGRDLIAMGLKAGKVGGERLVILVGDPSYYGRYGFKAVAPGQILFPGPVDPMRILAAELAEGALADYRGLIAALRS